MSNQDQGVPGFGSGRPIFKSKAAERSAELAAKAREDLELQRRLQDDFYHRNPKLKPKPKRSR